MHAECGRRAGVGEWIRHGSKGALGMLGVLAFLLLVFAPPAPAGLPTHLHSEMLGLDGLSKTVNPKEFNHACGTAVDSKGDIYVSSAGIGTVDIFDPAHKYLTSISTSNKPCGLAVNSKGDLFVSERATGKVVRYKPNVYPFSGTLIYGPREEIDSSGDAEGIAVDLRDDRLYVAEGDHVASYQVDGTLGINESQKITVGSTTTGGTFTLTFDGQTTTKISHNAKATTVQAALEALSNIDPGDVSVSETSGGINAFIVTFKGAYGATDVPQLIGSSSLSPNEVQKVTINATAGSYTLTFSGQTTGPIDYNADASVVKTALVNLSNLDLADISVSGGPGGPGGASPYMFTFEGAYAGTNVPQMSIDKSGLTGTGTVTTVTQGASLTVSTTVQSWSGRIGDGELSEASGVAAFTYASGDHYVFVTDAAGAAADRIYLFSGASITSLKLRRTIKSVNHDGNSGTPDQNLGFGPAGAYLAVDAGNRLEDIDPAPFSESLACNAPVKAQACTAGHLLFYDAAHNAVDEFDASGEFLDQFTDAAFADAEPTAMAVERSGGPNDGTIYISAGAGPGAQLLAFGPLAAPSRQPLKEPFSHKPIVNAQAVATDSHGDVYVAAGSSVHVYDSAGTQLTEFEDTEKPDDLAVDSTGKVYVFDRGNGFVSELKVTYYTPSAYPPVSGATYARHQPPIATPDEFPSGGEFLKAIAVNPSNDPASKDHLLVAASNVTHEYDSAANGSGFLRCFACTLNLGTLGSISVDGRSGNVYFGANARSVSIVNSAEERVAQISGDGCPSGRFGPSPGIAVDQSNGHLLEFQEGEAAREHDASGACVAEFGSFGDGGGRPSRIAIDNACAIHSPPLSEATTPTCEEFDPANGNVYVAYDDPTPGTFDLTAFAPLVYGEPPQVLTGTAGGVGAGDATLNGTVNPAGFELTECKFEYLTDAQYLVNGKTFAGASSKVCAESLTTIGEGNDPVPVHADLTGLNPDGRYRFRLVTVNKYGESPGAAGLFGPPIIITKAALPVLYDEATLRAEVDPSGLATKYHFEYGAKGAGEYDQSTSVVELPSGDGFVSVQAPLTGLAEGTEYHFRIVAENEAKAVPGLGEGDQTLVTLERRLAEDCPNIAYRTGLSTNLPDCRAYELVTPAGTNGLSPVGSGGADPGAQFNNWLAVQRGTGAGEALSYFTSGTLPGFEGNGLLDGYRASRAAGEHPKDGWTSELVGPTYVQSIPHFELFPAQQGTASDQLYSFWRIDPEGISAGTLPAGIYLRGPGGFEALGQGSLGTDLKAVSRFVSAGGTHVIFSSKEHLEEEAAPKGTEAIYDRAAGAANADLVSLKPDGSAFGAGEGATYVAASEDGSAILFKVGGLLYLRHEGQSIEIAASPNTFAGVSENGQHVFYAATSSGEVSATIFSCDVQAGPCAGAGAHSPTQIADDAIFINTSPDGSKAFFTSEEALTGADENEAGEVAEPSEGNLYEWDAQTETTHFIAVLDLQDFDSFGGVDRMNLTAWTEAINSGPHIARADSPTRNTPDGEVFVFQSHARLTSYDNEGFGEIYRYEPAAASGKQLLCISCDPSGAAPSADAMLEELLGSPLNGTTMIANVTDDGGKVFFQSADRLLPEDANGVIDVYEWRAEGEGCKRAAGCVALISSGQGDAPSFLYGMSADGHDVFFQALEELVIADVPGSRSIYDAREDGGIPESPVTAPCQGDACQGQGSSSPALAAPGDQTHSVGDEPTPPPCAKGKHRVKGHCVKKHHKRRHHRRANHNRGARR